MEWMIEGEPKKVVNYMINALGPEQFQRTVRNEMSRESNKPLIKNVVGFTNWLRASCKELSTFDGSVFEVTKMVRLDTIQIQTTAGPLLLRRTPAWVFEQETEKSTLILSRPVMERSVYSVDAILVRACGTQGEWDLQDLAVADISTTDRIRLLRDDALEGIDPELRAATPELTPPNAEMMVAEILADRVSEAAAGLRPNEITRLEAILLEYRDVFRIAFGDDPPIRVEPLRDGATPVRICARRYPPAHMEYLDQPIQELLDHELAFINPSSRWASPPRIVAKSEPGTYRMTVDTRAVNARTDPIQWSMPILEAVLTLLEGSSCYFTLDWFRGYWQLPLLKDSQEMFSIMTYRGIITPTRVLMGGMDAVAYCQHAVEEVFRSILYHGILAWLDDILGYASDPGNLLEILERVLAAGRSFGLKLHPGKCHSFLREAAVVWKTGEWSGGATLSVTYPKTGSDAGPHRCRPASTGHLIGCARVLPYSELAAPLLKIVDDAAKRVGGRKTK
ncbi:LOW QUALITY PROTEIN: Putative retroelement [Phytophthora palmivora]|uniref:Retroelement n=1 Tax=Phytophthora palmivora TaxID=4796 RepID=A0A2P4XFG2_9STRA|nr:LOW QUALITY PROTEIN: Putative retroelement [Phytophthora palmivora]